jgi:hypothetical protein
MAKRTLKVNFIDLSSILKRCLYDCVKRSSLLCVARRLLELQALKRGQKVWRDIEVQTDEQRPTDKQQIRYNNIQKSRKIENTLSPIPLIRIRRGQNRNA